MAFVQPVSAESQKNETWGCAFLCVIGFIALFSWCGGILSPKPGAVEPEKTAQQVQLEYDEFLKAEQDSAEEDETRKKLLREGYTPEQTEDIVGAAKVMRDRMRQERTQGRP